MSESPSRALVFLDEFLSLFSQESKPPKAVIVYLIFAPRVILTFEKMISAISDRPHVLILGAGLGGLCLAQSLRKKGVPFQIFERDRDIHARFQGWAIALHMYGFCTEIMCTVACKWLTAE